MSNSKFFTNVILTLMLIFILFPNVSKAQEDLDTAIGKLSDKISQHMAEKKKTKIAVIPFQDLRTDKVTTFGKYIAEELTTCLFNSGKFDIIERNLLAKILEELKLSQTGAVDPSSAKELGNITGVDAIVTGTIQDLITRVAINCRLIETETGNIFAAASEKIRKDESIAKIIEEVVEPYEPTVEETEEEKEKIIHFKNKIFYGNDKYERLCRVTLTSVKIFPERKTEFNLLYKNISDDEIKISVASISSRGAETYISDKLGNRYSLLSLSGALEKARMLTLPPGISTRVLFIFPPLKEKVDVINFVSTHGFFKKLAVKGFSGEMRNVIFRNIKLR